MTPEQIEKSVYNDLLHFNWESGKSITAASVNAQFLFEASCSFFYVPATGVLFSVERDGNYYHGYESIVKKCTKSDVLNIASRQLDYAHRMHLSDNVIAYWENIHEKISKF